MALPLLKRSSVFKFATGSPKCPMYNEPSTASQEIIKIRISGFKYFFNILFIVCPVIIAKINVV